MLIAPFDEDQYGADKVVPVSNKSVIGFPLLPLPRKVNSVAPAPPVKVPQMVTVVPGPIWLEPLPQFEELLNQAGGCGLLVQTPWLLPSGVM